MRSGRNQQGCVIRGYGIEMHAQGQHACLQVRRRLDVDDAGFDGPGPETFDFASLDNRDGAILMPRQGPVAHRSLVEVQSPDGTACLAENGSGNPADSAIRIEKGAQPRNAVKPGAGTKLVDG